MPVFHDANGIAVKFFLQKDLPQEVQNELCQTITSLGGRVETKVPRQGYILVQTGSSEEQRLRLCWSNADRPERFFVPYTYVEACKIAGMLLEQIFVDDGTPISMHIHQSVTNVNARSVLSQRIMHSGGDPRGSAQSARVILMDPNTDIFHRLIQAYRGVPEKHIESYLWVKKCVDKGAVLYTPRVCKNPGGRRPGEEPTQFTEDDEEHPAKRIISKNVVAQNRLGAKGQHGSSVMYKGTPDAATSMASHIPADEETDDERSEWAIRVGNSPPLLWGVDYGDGTKQRRLKVIADIRLHAPADMPVLLQAIQEIAAEFRFTVEEVQAYYDRCGEIGRARTRFQNMRELLTMEFPEDE